MLVDIIIIAIVAFFVFLGYKAGFIKSLIGMLSYVLSIIIAILIYPAVSEILAKTSLYTYLIEKTRDIPLAAVFATQKLEDILIKAIAFILVIILSRVILAVITKILNVFAKLPVIKSFNRLGGALIGGLKGILIVFIIFYVLSIYDQITLNDRSEVIEYIYQSSIAQEMYENNIILNIFVKGETGK